MDFHEVSHHAPIKMRRRELRPHVASIAVNGYSRLRQARLSDVEEEPPTEPAAEPNSEEPAAEPNRRDFLIDSSRGPRQTFPEELLARATAAVAAGANLSLALNRLVHRCQSSALHHWLKAVTPEKKRWDGCDDELQGAYVAQDDDFRETNPAYLSRSAQKEWLRLHFLQRIFYPWLDQAVDGHARRTVRNVCKRYRAKVLTTKAFACFAQHWQQRRARAEAVTQVIESWLSERLDERLTSALKAWRRLASKGALRRRCGEALTRFVRSGRFRLWLAGWQKEVKRLQRIRAGLSSRDRVIMANVGSKAWFSWRRWVSRARHRTLVIQQLQIHLAKRTIRRWVRIRRSAVLAIQYLLIKAFRGWMKVLARLRSAKLIQKTGYQSKCKQFFLRWKFTKLLLQREQLLSRHSKATFAHGRFRDWWKLFKAVRFGDRNLAFDIILIWRRIASRLSSNRAALERKIFGSPVGDGSESSQVKVAPKRRQRLTSRCFTNWRSYASDRRKRGIFSEDAASRLHQHTLARSLWMWHSNISTSRSSREHIERASMALEGIVAASNWAKTQEACEHWFAFAKARRHHRQMKQIVLHQQHLDAKAVVEPVTSRALQAKHQQHSPFEGSSSLRQQLQNLTNRRSSEVPTLQTQQPQHEKVVEESDGFSEWSHSDIEHLESQIGKPIECSSPLVEHGVSSSFSSQQSLPILRWLRWTIALLLGNAAMLPWLQWAFSTWRGAALRGELLRLRWKLFVLRRVSIRKFELRRLRLKFDGWYLGVAAQLTEEVAEATATLESISREVHEMSFSPSKMLTAPFMTEPVTVAAKVDYKPRHSLPKEIDLPLLRLAFLTWSGLAPSSYIERAHNEADLLLWAFTAWAVRVSWQKKPRFK